MPAKSGFTAAQSIPDLDRVAEVIEEGSKDPFFQTKGAEDRDHEEFCRCAGCCKDDDHGAFDEIRLGNVFDQDEMRHEKELEQSGRPRRVTDPYDFLDQFPSDANPVWG